MLEVLKQAWSLKAGINFSKPPPRRIGESDSKNIWDAVPRQKKKREKGESE